MSRTRVTTSSSDSSVDGFTFGSSELMIAGRRRTFALGAGRDEIAGDEGDLGVRFRRRRSSAFATPSVRSFCGLNGGILAESSETVSERLPETRTKGRVRTSSRSRTRVEVGMRSICRATLGSVMAASRSVLRNPVDVLADAVERAAQRRLDALRRRGEIGFAVERSKNGAAHQGSAAQSGQDRAAEPLQREPAPVDQTARAPVDRKRRLVAEIDGLGLEPPICAAQPSLVQDHVPCSRDRTACRPAAA